MIAPSGFSLRCCRLSRYRFGAWDSLAIERAAPFSRVHLLLYSRAIYSCLRHQYLLWLKRSRTSAQPVLIPTIKALFLFSVSHVRSFFGIKPHTSPPLVKCSHRLEVVTILLGASYGITRLQMWLFLIHEDQPR